MATYLPPFFFLDSPSIEKLIPLSSPDSLDSTHPTLDSPCSSITSICTGEGQAVYSGMRIEPANTNWRMADESWPTAGSKPDFGKGFLGKMMENQIVEDPNRLHNTSGTLLSYQPLHTQQNFLLTHDLDSSTSESQQYFSGCNSQSSGLISSFSSPSSYSFSPIVHNPHTSGMLQSQSQLSLQDAREPTPAITYSPQPYTRYPNSNTGTFREDINCKFCVQWSHNLCTDQKQREWEEGSQVQNSGIEWSVKLKSNL